MTACLALSRDCSRKHVAVDDPTESQVAASDSPEFPKGAPPGVSRASGVSKFFENIKPLSDFFGEILDAAGSCIAKLFHFNKLVDCEIPVTIQEEVVSQNDKQYSAVVENHSALQSQQHNAVLTFAVASSSSEQRKASPSILEDATSASISQVWDSQSRNPPEEWEGILFNSPSDDDVRTFGELLTSSCDAQKDNPIWIYV